MSIVDRNKFVLNLLRKAQRYSKEGLGAIYEKDLDLAEHNVVIALGAITKAIDLLDPEIIRPMKE